MPAASERMSRVDTAWLRMDNDVNLMMIVGVLLLQPALDYDELCARVQAKLLRYGRFGQKVVPDTFGASWVDDAKFDIRRHVVREKLARGKGQSERQALQALCGKLATRSLDPQRPLWQFHLVERYQGGSALIVRIHHCIGDGIALVSVVLSITDGGADPPSPRPRREASEGEGGWLSDAVIEPLTDIAVKALGVTGKGVARSVEMLSQPQQMLGSLELARVGYRLLADVAALALMADDSRTRLKGMPAGRKRVAWNEPIPLDAVKMVGKALHCSVNDVLLSCAAGAIGRYLRDRGDDPAGQEIRAMVPVNLRPLDQAWQLGNKFGLAPLVLPIGIDNPIERVYAVRRRMAELKGSYQPLLAFAVLAVAGLTIKPVQDAILDLFAKKTTAVMTNVPGPGRPLRLCGSEIRQTMFWVPASGHIGVGVSILSYAGSVQFGLMTDAALCPDPQAIIDRFGPEFEQLLVLTLMLPWS
ncbi:MAG: putative diacylglycerol O-acyltransferase tgs1 [Burkholderiaceae bacterium]|nr:putative diacylglycerol O-acyltransferase tgs1 [Burkholderiaceae bacterium]